jgi:hypothetical protein
VMMRRFWPSMRGMTVPGMMSLVCATTTTALALGGCRAGGLMGLTAAAMMSGAT